MFYENIFFLFLHYLYILSSLIYIYFSNLSLIVQTLFFNSHSPIIDNLSSSSSSYLITNSNLDHQRESYSIPPIRQSTIIIKILSYFWDYHCQLASHSWLQSNSLIDNFSSIKFPLCNVLSYHKLSSSHKHFALTIFSNLEPQTFSQAIQIPNWQTTTDYEIKTLEANKTWTLCTLLIRNKAIDYKWVYMIKYKTDGSIERYKICLVAKRYNQIEGLDFQEIFSLVAKLTAVRCLIALAAIKNWYLHQFDINNLFAWGGEHHYPT